MSDESKLEKSLDTLKNELIAFKQRYKLFKDLSVISLVAAVIFFILFLTFLVIFIINLKVSTLFLVLAIIFLVLFFIGISGALFFFLFQKNVYEPRIKAQKKLVDIVEEENRINFKL